MKLIVEQDQNVNKRILKVMERIQNESTEYEFSGVKNRYMRSGVSFLIEENDEDIGFVYLTCENKKGMLFLDISILRGYRSKGIGYEAIKELLERYNACGKWFVLAEVEKDNIACLKVMEKLGGIQVSEKHFLLQPDRIKEFREFIINESVELMSEDVSQKAEIEEIHEKKGKGRIKK